MYYEPGTLLGVKDTVVNKRDKTLCHSGAYILEREPDNKQKNKWKYCMLDGDKYYGRKRYKGVVKVVILKEVTGKIPLK